MSDIIEEVRETEKQVIKTKETIEDLITKLSAEKETIEKKFLKISQDLQMTKFNREKLKELLEEPYALVSRKKDEWYVIVPTCFDFQIGWLEKTVKAYNYFIVNKYVNWLSQVPKQLQEKFNFPKPLPITVFNSTVLTGTEHQDEVWKRYSKHLTRREGKDKIKIKKGREFNLLAELISDGIMPFMAKPIKEKDYRKVKLGFKLRDYQIQAWDKFKEFGAVGVYWAMGAGKTFFGLNALAHIKGDKLVVVPTKMLKEQWEERIRQYIPSEFHHETEIGTYQGLNKIRNKEFKLIIFDECHRLPANTFSRLATVKTEYRIGLSATPYREDGRTDYIFALTGWPIGMDWKDLLEQGIIGKPTVTLYIMESTQSKFNKIAELLKDDKKTLIYSYWIELGERISKQFEIPFVYGGSKGRLEVLKQANVAVVSSVGTEGVSLPNLERIIEVGFQFGSRREEAQLMGRLFHSIEDEPEHIILMTEQELENYEKRLLSIYEKGFRINIIR